MYGHFWTLKSASKSHFTSKFVIINVNPKGLSACGVVTQPWIPRKLKAKPQIVWFMGRGATKPDFENLLLGDDAINSLSLEIIGDDAESRR